MPGQEFRNLEFRSSQKIWFSFWQIRQNFGLSPNTSLTNFNIWVFLDSSRAGANPFAGFSSVPTWRKLSCRCHEVTASIQGLVKSAKAYSRIKSIERETADLPGFNLKPGLVESWGLLYTSRAWTITDKLRPARVGNGATSLMSPWRISAPIP